MIRKRDQNQTPKKGTKSTNEYLTPMKMLSPNEKSLMFISSHVLCSVFCFKLENLNREKKNL